MSARPRRTVRPERAPPRSGGASRTTLAREGLGPSLARGERIALRDTSLLDLVDNVLNKGIVLTGDVVISIAEVDLIYLRLGLLLCAADKIAGRSPLGPARRRRS